MSERNKWLADNPITCPSEDTIGRNKPAKSFAELVLSIDRTEGAVVGVLGPWGSGKTSFINLACEHLKENNASILEFNPWLFSGADQLVQAFFAEISAQLKIKTGLRNIGQQLEGYGEAFSGLGWIPVVGTWIERLLAVMKVASKLLLHGKEGINTRRSKIRKTLASVENPIIVVLDDIDRLSSLEIRDIFRLVRLTANFPNIIYVLAFDRLRVEQALGEQGVPGRDYLEKILQIGIDLPKMPDNVLNSQISRSIEEALSKIENKGPFDQTTWPDVFMEIIRPLIRNMRDVRRYAIAIHGTVRELEGQVALVDVLALEAIRIFLPDVFSNIPGAIEGLTNTSDGYLLQDDTKQLKAQIDKMVEAAKEREEVVRSLIRRVFLAGQRHVGGSSYGNEWKSEWLQKRCAAHEYILLFYLERVMSGGFESFTAAEKAWALMADRGAFETYLRSIEVERLQDVISSLEAYENQFKPQHVIPGTVVLLNLLPELPERQHGIYGFGTRMTVGRVIYRLVRSIKDQMNVENAVNEILPQVSYLSSKLELISQVGYKEGAGHKLVSEEYAKKLEKEWRADVSKASNETLGKETELFMTFKFAKMDAEPDEPAIKIPESPLVTQALLWSARSEMTSQAIGNRFVKRSSQLAWDGLIELYGSEETLRERVEVLKNSKPREIGDLLELADKYLSGWRPNFRDGD
ncbi:MAG TPA: P-loop NTPase fold protein [Acidobacteriota bacterium]|nr:P-loop NTPase fold protein [Acidobacteriota bacterium]HQO18813.1 P-loop NTPase fold protein [Acidobacteriota bacterium]